MRLSGRSIERHHPPDTEQCGSQPKRTYIPFNKTVFRFLLNFLDRMTRDGGFPWPGYFARTSPKENSMFRMQTAKGLAESSSYAANKLIMQANVSQTDAMRCGF